MSKKGLSDPRGTTSFLINTWKPSSEGYDRVISSTQDHINGTLYFVYVDCGLFSYEYHIPSFIYREIELTINTPANWICTFQAEYRST